MTSFEQEWAQAKADASADVSTRLASADGWNSGGNAGGLRSDKKAWSAAASGVGTLKEIVKTALTELERGQKSPEGFDPLAVIPVIGPTVAPGSQCVAAQREVYQSWKRYLDDVTGRCDALKGRLEKSGQNHYKNDKAVQGAFEELEKRYKDTPRAGGQSRAR
ncbi:hypothetical protein TPA0910_69520 [Streptomyces hygroscopicus subsp. sporocinereus]|uniref:Uncharacterized protein n=1 Tax=Streptomyces hygroscopicus TaxID=1912 RepID=A0ABQ3UAB3_STRHY|nr:hypothetical protein TPA0910_69520 [Streptomyces hygroscopicus]